MLKKLFGLGKSKGVKIESEKIFAPLTGKLLNIEEVPDPTFAQKMMGDGIAIEPTEGLVTSPVEGEIIQVFPTKHAIGIKSLGGLEILIHIGLETVSMKGEGFTTFIKEGDKVKVGDRLVEFSLDLVKEKASSIITPIVITNGERVNELTKENITTVTASKTEVIEVKLN
ncbi:PTS glucose transporter subunit IIA [Anaerobacillus alkalidiazotrophicus]|uniref:PTS glucose transporter subunit IIA n=1 Tax=Anaerobacillus alkalidiazotrophicus TaxID=472963 RepID=A0A1S2M734_9BACI|nr:PTS glucose transporter subunit IIA [Anaerobacillus alkalidiazotrophicus]OIJ20366.1 PTS glucose transporter subunit IIA [Anaerobacillus alkalidiazotrophicus]